MKNADSRIGVATAHERATSMPGLRPGAAAAEPMPDITDACRLNLARALRLGQLLRVRVLVDESGWLRRDIEIAYQRERGNAIRPVTARVGLEMTDEDVIADGGPVAQCRRYNTAIAKLGELAFQLAEKVRAGQVTIRTGSPIAEAHRELDGLDAMIAARQAKHMGHGVVRHRALVTETELLESRYTQLAVIVSSSLAGSSVGTGWDGDTQEMDPADQ
jgi:hypothetical protein